jgi:hypothetical protein
MILSRNKLYTLLFAACLTGYIWLYYQISASLTETNSVDVCLIKKVTNIPCPSCGSTRSLISLTQGNFFEAFYLNPFGYLIAVGLLMTPIWVIMDVTTRSNTLLNSYILFEAQLKNPKLAIPLILLTIINWIWNITKGL